MDLQKVQVSYYNSFMNSIKGIYNYWTSSIESREMEKNQPSAKREIPATYRTKIPEINLAINSEDIVMADRKTKRVWTRG